MNEDIRAAYRLCTQVKDIKIKNKHRVQFLKYGSTYHYDQYVSLRSLIKKNVKLAHNAYMHKVEASLLQDPKKFWGYAKSLKSMSGVPISMVYNGVAAAGAEAAAEQFALSL